VTTHLSGFQPRVNWHQAGLIAWNDDRNYLNCNYQWSDKGRRVFTFSPRDSGKPHARVLRSLQEEGEVWLRISRRGDRYEFLASQDGKSYRSVASGQWGVGVPKYLGLLARNGPAAQLGRRLRRSRPALMTSSDERAGRAGACARRKQRGKRARRRGGQEKPERLARSRPPGRNRAGLRRPVERKGPRRLVHPRRRQVRRPGRHAAHDGRRRQDGLPLVRPTGFRGLHLVVEYRVFSRKTTPASFSDSSDPDPPRKSSTRDTRSRSMICGTNVAEARERSSGWREMATTLPLRWWTPRDPPGQWNRFAIRVQGQKYAVALMASGSAS